MLIPPYTSYPILTGNQVMLRQITVEDIQDIIAISYYDGLQASNLEQAIAMQEEIRADYLRGDSIHWGIIDRTTNKIVGTCGYYRGFLEGAGELGCILLPQYYGQGYMTLSMQLAIDYGLTTMRLKRIYAITSRENEKAIQLLERLNFTRIKALDDPYLEFDLTSN